MNSIFISKVQLIQPNFPNTLNISNCAFNNVNWRIEAPFIFRCWFVKTWINKIKIKKCPIVNSSPYNAYTHKHQLIELIEPVAGIETSKISHNFIFQLRNPNSKPKKKTCEWMSEQVIQREGRKKSSHRMCLCLLWTEC